MVTKDGNIPPRKNRRAMAGDPCLKFLRIFSKLLNQHYIFASAFSITGANTCVPLRKNVAF
jgi:hypothetical protein